MADIAVCGALLLIAFAVTVAVVPFVKKLAYRLDAIDYPSGRRVNKTPTPRLGGMAMFFGMSAALLLMLFLIKMELWDSPMIEHPVLNVDYTWTAIGVLLMFLVGVVDDIYDLHPKAKLIGQISAATVVACSGVIFTSIHNPFGGYIHFGWAGYPLTVVYLVAFANIMNLIDGLDGLAGGISTITASTLLVFAVISARPDAVVFCCVVIGACLGFLKYNWHPASIFMGDSGSLLLGFMLGIISLFVLARAAIFTSLLVPLLAAGVPIIDTATSIIRRIKGHQPIDQADKGHIHHRLLESGHDHKSTVKIMLAWTALLSVGGIIITRLDDWSRLGVFLVLTGISIIAVYKLKLLHPVLQHKYNPRFSRRHVKDGTFPAEYPNSPNDGDEDTIDDADNTAGIDSPLKNN